MECQGILLPVPANVGDRGPDEFGQEHKSMTYISELMTVADFCTRYSIGRTSFYREVAAKRLRIRKFGKATRVTRADAEAWVANLPTVEKGAA